MAGATTNMMLWIELSAPMVTPCSRGPTALRARCREGVGIVGHRDRFYEPLAAFYPRELLPLAQAALERRELSLQRLIAAACAQGLLLVHEISAAEAAYFENWNDPPRP